MSNFKLLKQLKYIIDKVTNYPGISKQKILDSLKYDHELQISTRTLERHFERLDLEFGIDIKYNYSTKGYEIGEENDEARLAEFLKFLELSSLAEFYVENLKDFSRFKKYVLPEDNSAFKGLDYIKTIFSALQEERFISFKKENYYKEGITEYTVIPLKIKEYKNRWYLIAGLKDEIDIRNFGLDRIFNIEIGKKHKTKLEPYNKLITAYDEVVGLNYSDYNTPVKVVLHVDTNQINYLKSLPLHHSQVIGATVNTNWIEVTYYLKPNYELEVELLKMAGKVIVVEPAILKEKITNHLKQMLNNYKE